MIYNAPTVYRNFFPIFKTHPDLIYLDSAATALKPQSVITSLNAYNREYSSNIHRGLYEIANQATTNYEQARQSVSRFISASSSSEIVWTKSATESLNLLAFCLQSSINQGDEILITQVEHHANLLPWQRLAQNRQATLKYLPLNLKTFQIESSHLHDLVTPKTKIVSLSHASNVTGAVNDISSLVNQIKSINSQVVVIVDGAQAISHLPVDVQALGCDFYVFSGHKLFGPTGIGVLWGKLSLLNNLPPYQLGGDMITHVDFTSAQFALVPLRFEAGTPPIGQAIALGEACDFLTRLNRQTISSYLDELTTYTLSRLTLLDGLKIIGPLTNRIGVISFTLPHIHPHDIAQFLSDHHIAIRAGHHCAMPLHSLLSLPATARISLQIYNTKEDIDQTFFVLKQLIKLFNK